MNDFRSFDQVKTNELFITRHKWFFSYYELTDGQFVYGKLSYKKSFKSYAIIETAQGNWTIKPKGWFKRSLLINKGDDGIIGTLIPETWKRNVNLEMDNGFKGTYLYKKLFSRSLTFTHEMYGDVLYITQKPWLLKRPFIITYYQNLKVNNLPAVPLLALIGVNLILIRQAHANAAAH
jgi:hypothetical protein